MKVLVFIITSFFVIQCHSINEWFILRQSGKQFEKEYKEHCSAFPNFRKLDPCAKIKYMDSLITHKPINEDCFADMMFIMREATDTFYSPAYTTPLDLLVGSDSIYYSERVAWKAKLKCQ